MVDMIKRLALDGFISLTDTYIFYLFLCLLLHKRNIITRTKIYSVFIVMVLHIVSSFYLNTTTPSKLIVLVSVDIIFSLILFESTWYKYLLSVILFYILMAMVEFTIFSLSSQLMPDFDIITVSELYSPQLYIITIIIRLLELAIILMIKTIKNRPVYRNYWLGLLLMPIFTMIFVWVIYPSYWSLRDESINNLLIAISIFLVIQNLFIFTYIAAVQGSTERYFAIKKAYDRQKQYSTTISTIQKAVRKMAHDIRHHFIYLRSALDQEDILKAKLYLTTLDENLENLIPLNVTGHYDVDALLHAKASIAEKLGIHISVEGTLPPELMISPIDLSALLGNSIDNAIESASRINGQKEISISFYYNASRLNYTISNPYIGELQRKPNGYFVSKKGSGLGFEIMDEVVKKYGGALLTENDDSNFKLTIMLQTNQS